MATVTVKAQTIMTEVGENTSDAALLDVFEIWTKRAYQEVGSRSKWKFMKGEEDISTVASTKTYKLSRDAVDMLALRIKATDDRIEFRTFATLQNDGFDLEEEGRPVFWDWDDAIVDTGDQNRVKLQFKLHPIPNAVFVLQALWRKQVDELGDSDTIPLPFEFQHILDNLVLSAYHQHEREFEMADRHRGLADRGIERMLAKYKVTEDAIWRFEVTDVPERSNFFRPVRLPPGQFSNHF